MLSIQIVAVGKLSEAHWRLAAEEYQKRLGAYCKLEMVEITEQKLPDNPSPAQIVAGALTEGEQILAKIPPSSFIIAMCIEGREHSSQQLAQLLQKLPLEGKSHISFVIGGSHGLSDRVKARSHIRMSVSPMTFPHQLLRVMLLEQVYRGFTINAGQKYHK